MSDRAHTATAEDAARARGARERKKRYKQSLNLPKTSFAMRANLNQHEPLSQRRWEKTALYRRVQEAHANEPPFVFHDGPPYANGAIHVGHLLNKVLKDLVVRTQTMSGKSCPYIPGWDCHGLPIEHRVMTEMQEKGKLDKLEELDDDTRRMVIRRECAAYATKFKELQAKQMQRLLTLADYENPYATMTPDYERAVLEVFAGLIDQGLVYRALKPVYWSIEHETALAEAELEYHDREDPSIYVWFEAADAEALAGVFGVEVGALGEALPPSFMIWTTTPWTLPANLLIAVHENFDYSLVRLGDRVGVVASRLVESVARARDRDPGSLGKPVEKLGEVKGRELLGLGYRHPFRSDGPEGAFRLVAADYVTLEDGTGLVHTAPGHGAEDYATGLEEGVPIYCPVQDDGTYDESVPDWLRGMSIWTANDEIVGALERSDHLFHHHRFTHSYPHDWRSKTPVIFRGTEQWFISVDRPMKRNGGSLRQAALAATEEVRFVPDWGRNRFRGMIESRPDWCLSRQRAWGLPIPAFRTPDGEVLLTSGTVRALAAVVGKAGSDAWFEMETTELLAEWDPKSDPDAPDHLDPGTLEKLYDIFDVWFESGSSWNAVIRQRGYAYPTDLYLEGSDQHRGWFQTSMLPALGVTGASPFRTVLTHGFFVDKEGRKMSKSLGNTLEVEDLLREFGADVCRWWVSSLAYENDFKVDWEYFVLAGESYRKVRNTLRFLLGNLADFEPGSGPDLEPLTPQSLDAWALERASELRSGVMAAYAEFDFRQAHLLLFDFCNETLSSVYLDAVKDRLYCDRSDSPRRRATQSVMAEIALLLIELLAPILPHTADEAYRALAGAEGDADTVHVRSVHPLSFRADEGWAKVFEVRRTVLRALEAVKAAGLENSLDAGVVVPDPDGTLLPFEPELADLCGVSRVSRDPTAEEVAVVDLRDQPRCERSWRRDETVKLRSDGGWLSDRDAEAVGAGAPSPPGRGSG